LLLIVHRRHDVASLVLWTTANGIAQVPMTYRFSLVPPHVAPFPPHVPVENLIRLT
jgi:hypothetical protein